MASSLALVFDILAKDRASQTFRNVGDAADDVGRKTSKFGVVAKAGLAAAGTAAVAFAVKSIKSGADFDATMRQIAAVTGEPKAGLKSLSDLAIKFGADTTFSAGEAGQAMLELAKGGLTTAQIKAGALDSTLTLAAAGGVELGAAAVFVSNGLNTFGLKAEQAGQVAAALAGGANSSSASVESLGQALGQVGPGALNAGLSIQETVAALAAFDQAGIKGSDAGTSLKTMLTRLVPQTNAAQNAMKDLGLKFTDAQGNFLPLRDVAEQLRTKLAGLSEEQRTTALATIFGSDATRAASVLAKEGAAGIDRYTKATSDQAAAQRQAKVGTEGVKGALEALSGSIDTVFTRVGLALGPTVEKVVRLATAFTNQLIPAFSNGGGIFSKVADAVKPFIARIAEVGSELGQRLPPLVDKAVAIFRNQLVPTIRTLIPVLTPIVAFLLKVFGGAVIGAFNGALNVIKGALNIIQGVVKVFTAALKGDWTGVWNAVKQIVTGAFTVVVGAIQVFLNVGILRAFTLGFAALRTLLTGSFNAIKAVFTGSFTFLTGLVTRGLTAIRGFFTTGFTAVRTTVTAAFTAIKQAVGNAMIAARTQVGAILAGIRALFTAAFNAYVVVVRTAFGAILGAVRSALSAIIGAIRAPISTVGGIFQGAFNAAVGAVRAGVGAILGLIRGLGGSIRGATSGFGGILRSAGADIIRGLASGITGAIGQAVEAAKRAARAVVNGVKGALGIASPSKVMMGLGKETAVGFALGIENNKSRVENAFGSLTPSVIKTPTAPLGAAAFGAGTTTINNTFNTGADIDAVRLAALLRRTELLYA